jgi:hypothetical protein
MLRNYQSQTLFERRKNSVADGVGFNTATVKQQKTRYN